MIRENMQWTPKCQSKWSSGNKTEPRCRAKAVGSEVSYQLSLPPGSALTTANSIIFSPFRQAYSNSRASRRKAKPEKALAGNCPDSNSRASEGKAKLGWKVEH